MLASHSGRSRSGAIVILTYRQSPEARHASEARSSDWLSGLQANVPGLKINKVDLGEFVLDQRVVPPRVNTFAYTMTCVSRQTRSTNW